jgi:alkylation response protein AidB-like acyl-CoA dehydrogenase
LHFELTDEQKMIQQTAREFADNEVAPVADAHNRERRFPRRWGSWGSWA